MVLKLSWKVALAMVLVSALTTLFAAVLTDRALDRQFSSFLDAAQRDRNQQVLETVKELYAQDGAEPSLERQLELLSLAADVQITVTPPPSRRPMHGHMGMGRQMMRQQASEEITRPSGGEATITVLPVISGENTVNEAAFRRTVNKSIFLAALFSLGAALVISAFLSWGLTKPFNQLVGMVRRVGRGEWDAKIEFKGDNEFSFLGREFNQMAANLQQMEEMRIKLTNDVAHELRTPLAGIQAYLEAMHDGVLTADNENLELVLEETERLKRLLQGLQELAQAETPLRTQEKVDLNRMIAGLLDPLRILAEEKDLSLNWQPGAPLYTRGDPEALAAAVRNVVINGIKYTPEGGAVSVKLKEAGAWSLIEISDTGIGIEAQELPLIFERFYRTDSSRSRETGGTGIGLALTAEIIKGHGGRIEVSSEPGSGSTFRILLPRKGD